MRLDALHSLSAFDSYSFFDKEGGLIRTGLTGTNVMDLHVLLCQVPSNHAKGKGAVTCSC